MKGELSLQPLSTEYLAHPRLAFAHGLPSLHSLPQPPLARPAHANLFQVLVLNILKVGKAGNIEVITESQEVLL
jgi:hypothetical protein